jgi:hypothetical protein
LAELGQGRPCILLVAAAVAGAEGAGGLQPTLLQAQVQAQMQAQIPEQAAAGKLLGLVGQRQDFGSQGLAMLVNQAGQQGFQAIVLALQQGLPLGPAVCGQPLALAAAGSVDGWAAPAGAAQARAMGFGRSTTSRHRDSIESG